MLTKNKIILFEGVSGIGKSTIAQFIEIQFKKNNRPCKWFFEMENNNPIGRPFISDHEIHQIDEIKNKWISFSNFILNEDKTYLFDGRYFSLIITKFLKTNSSLNLNDYYSEINKFLIKNNPLLIYLYPNNIKKTIENTYHFSRNQKNYKINYDLWERMNKIAISLFDTFKYDKLLFNIDEYTWSNIYSKILKKLKLNYFKIENSINENRKLIGKYKDKESSFKIIEKDNYLFLHNHPFFKNKIPFNKMDWKLIELDNYQFTLQGLNIFLNFKISNKIIMEFIIVDNKEKTKYGYEKT